MTVSRKSKREVERALDEYANADDYPMLTLTTILAADTIKEIDGARSLVAVDGKIRRQPAAPPTLRERSR